MSDGGKGSAPRPFGVDRKTFERNWDVIFGKKTPPEQPKDQNESPPSEVHNAR